MSVLQFTVTNLLIRNNSLLQQFLLLFSFFLQLVSMIIDLDEVVDMIIILFTFDGKRTVFTRCLKISSFIFTTSSAFFCSSAYQINVTCCYNTVPSCLQVSLHHFQLRLQQFFHLHLLVANCMKFMYIYNDYITMITSLLDHSYLLYSVLKFITHFLLVFLELPVNHSYMEVTVVTFIPHIKQWLILLEYGYFLIFPKFHHFLKIVA